ncbi:MAG: ribonuclease R [Chitinophagia bacterium]|jgi:ribonuclease R|nr:ribonuclease R [Chitinophagia bacterium]
MGTRKNDKKTKKTKTTKHTHIVTSYKGVLDIAKSGMGFVMVAGLDNDILVYPNDFNTALKGDEVSVKITKIRQSSGKKEGKILEVLKRKQVSFAGTMQVKEKIAFFIPSTVTPMPDIFIPMGKLNGAKDKDRVIVQLTKWEKTSRKPEGEVLRIFTPEQENDLAMQSIVAEAGFSLSFSDEVNAFARSLSDKIDAAELGKRKDYRKVLTFTIDPADAKDFDDAISYQKLPNGHLEIGVHIADVSHFVQPGTAVDKEAYERATSVYLPDRVYPMLPERISNELCSLRPNEDKLTFSACFEVDAQGKIVNTWFGKTIIHSDRRFTYEQVQEIIDTKIGDHSNEILWLLDWTQKLRKARFDNGAINFSSQEVRFTLDEKGKPTGISIKESKESHQLIEELMLKANQLIAQKMGQVKIKKETLPFPYRVHDQPNEEKLSPFIVFAKKHGYAFDISTPTQIAHSFNALMIAAKGKPEQHVLEQLGIRTMAKAVYTSENIGHYGLGFEYYCHFTSPIRRYPDILVHRIVQSVLVERPINDAELEQKCVHCSERERAAMESERAANKYKQVEFMRDYLGHSFEGIISGVSSFGFWVETIEHKCEGLVSVVSLSKFDDFRLVESDYALVGMRSGRKFNMGDKVTIKVVAASLEKRQLDYEWDQTK